MSFVIPTSTAGWFFPMRTGLIYRETFEDPNFVVDNNWLNLQGIAVQSSAESVDVANGTNQGLYSMPLANSDIANAIGASVPVVPPIIEQVINYASASVIGKNPMVGVWYFDPGFNSATSGVPGPYLKIQLSDGNFVQMGVRNAAVSGHTNYVAGGPTQDTFQYHLTTPRANGAWVHYQLVYGSGILNPSGYWVPYINNVQAYPGPIVSGVSNQISAIFLNGDTLGSTSDSFGFWDELHYNRDQGVSIYSPYNGANRNFYIKDSNYNALTNFVISSGFPTETGYNIVNDNIQPAQIWIEASQADNTQTPTTLETDIRLSNVWNGDQYQYQNVVFPSPMKAYDDMASSISQNNKAAQGQIETIVTGQNNMVNVIARKISGFSFFTSLQQMYQQMRYSRPISLAINTSLAACVPVLSGSTGSTSFTVGSTLGVTANNLLPGYWYVIEDIYGQYRQWFKIQSVNGAVVTLADGAVLNFDVGSTNAVGSQFFIRNTQYYYALGLADPTKLGLKVAVPTVPRFDWQEKLCYFIYS